MVIVVNRIVFSFLALVFSLFTINGTAAAEDFWQPLEKAFAEFSEQNPHRIVRVRQSNFTRDRALSQNLDILARLNIIEDYQVKQADENELYTRVSEKERWIYRQYDDQTSFLFWNEAAVSAEKGVDIFKRELDTVLENATMHLQNVVKQLGLGKMSIVFQSAQIMRSGTYDVLTRRIEEHIGAYLGSYQRYLQDNIPIVGDGGTGYVLMSPDGAMIGLSIDLGNYIDHGVTEHGLVSNEQLIERARKITDGHVWEGSKLIDVQCGYLDLGASLGFTQGELPLVCQVVIYTSDETSQGVIFDIPVTVDIPELSLFTEAMRLLGRDRDDSHDTEPDYL